MTSQYHDFEFPAKKIDKDLSLKIITTSDWFITNFLLFGQTRMDNSAQKIDKWFLKHFEDSSRTNQLLGLWSPVTSCGQSTAIYQSFLVQRKGRMEKSYLLAILWIVFLSSACANVEKSFHCKAKNTTEVSITELK